jgi:hypothetical protein
MAGANNTSFNTVRISKVRDTITTLVNQHFASTLGREADIVNLVNALVCKESKFNVNAIGPVISSGPKNAGGVYLGSSAIKSLITNPSLTPLQRQNIDQGLRGVGLMQCLGLNHVRGGSPAGICELERLRPDICQPLLVNPGEDLYSVVLGESNVTKSILAGLIILEGKYKATNKSGDYFSVRGDPYNRKFVTRMQGAVAAYLGLGRSDLNGTTPELYSNQIVGGSFYLQANGKSPISIQDSEVKVISSNGPSTNSYGMNKIRPPGC